MTEAILILIAVEGLFWILIRDLNKESRKELKDLKKAPEWMIAQVYSDW